MRQQLLKKYTVLIARTGQTPVTLRFTPLSALVILVVITGLPLGWLGTVVFSLFNSNVQLTQENQQLTEKAHEVLTEIDHLDSEIDTLRERAGIEEIDLPSVSQAPPRGGVPAEVSAVELYDQAARRVPALDRKLDVQVKPALVETLEAEEAKAVAFPDGKPLTIPLAVTSGFGLRPNPFGGRSYEKHTGLDFAGPVGSPIVATAKGRVVRASYYGGYGKTVEIEHGYGHKTLYAHLSDITVEVGDMVNEGDVVGKLGNTGRSTGPHLHYEIRLNGEPLDPMAYLRTTEVDAIANYWQRR
ncbi:MAG: M23 family metallopeptidase [Cyanobacteria bacterium J06632_22]